MDELYSDIILDLYRHPHNSGTLAHPTVRVTEYNPLCGDAITMDIGFNKKGTVKQVKFLGQGCAISQAATSLLTDELIGKTRQEIQSLSSEDVLAFLHIPITPARMKCALLGLAAAKNAAAQNELYKKSVCKKKR